jgi:hypothetical protein
MPRILRIAFPLLIGSLIPAAFAWHDTGHMAVARIAASRLSPAAMAEASRLAKIGGTEKTNELVTAACWADDFKSRENGLWHYINYHFRTDGKPTEMKPEPQNVVWAIRKFSSELGNGGLPDAQRATALRYLLHFVGDIHNPLHCVARDTDAFPTGDRGGNDFKLIAPKGMNPVPRNLHALWDMGAGLLPQVERPLSPDGRRLVNRIAQEAMEAFPAESLKKESSVLDPEAWSLEGLAFAKARMYAFPENTEPPKEYLSMCRQESERFIALAGYRLAEMLNGLLKRP